LRKVHLLLATGLGIGDLPRAPGTLATLVAVILYLVFRKILPGPLSYGIMLVLFSGMAVWICGTVEKYLGKKDSSAIVIDEMAGFLLAMFLVPFSVRMLILGFILFRAFDILKPFRIDRIESLPGGWGVVGDDLAAGILTNILLHVSLSMFGW